jgi:hypothetical protein
MIVLRRTRRTSRGACWPDEVEELLLAAALLEGDAAVDAWRRFRAGAEPESLEPQSQQLLPLIYRRLLRQGYQDDAMPRLKGAYRWTWSRNQIFCRSAGAAILDLQAAGIETLVLKGGALALLDYHDLGARAMVDLDVLVRPEQVGRAAEILKTAGWRPVMRRPTDLLGVVTAHPFLHEGGRGIDLHWHALGRRQSDDDLWANAVPLTLGAAQTLAPDAAGRLMHVCVHGAESGPPPHVRWVADAATVVTRGEVTWRDLVERAERRQVTVILAQTLGYLRERFEVAIPDNVLAELRAVAPSRFERAAFRAATRPRTIGNVTRQEWFRYRRMTRRRSWPAFLSYLQLSMGYERRRDLARHVVRRLVHGPT